MRQIEMNLSICLKAKVHWRNLQGIASVESQQMEKWVGGGAEDGEREGCSFSGITTNSVQFPRLCAERH